MIVGVVGCLGDVFRCVADTTYIGVQGSIAISLVCELMLSSVYFKICILIKMY